DVAQLGIGAHAGPAVGAAGPLPRSVEPRFVAELAGAGDRLEPPPHRARTHVVGANVAERARQLSRILRRALAVVIGLRLHRLRVAVAGDDYDVADDEREARPGVAARRQPIALREIDVPVLAEIGLRLAGLGVEREQVAPADAQGPDVAAA